MFYFNKYFKVLKYVLVFFLMLSLVVACEGQSNLGMKDAGIDFPKDEKGYPKNDIVMINGKSYAINIAKVLMKKLKKSTKWKLT